jgi:hypothetical protein
MRVMPGEPLVEIVESRLHAVILRYGLEVGAEGDQVSTYRACVSLRSDEFVVTIIRDRGEEWIDVGSKIRPGPRKPIRSWSLGHLVAFLDGATSPYPIGDLATELDWLDRRAGEILDSALINSKGLSAWAVAASRRLWGQKRRG